MEQQIILEKQDMTYLSWAKVRNSSGTAGSFLKSYSDLGGQKIRIGFQERTCCAGEIAHLGPAQIGHVLLFVDDLLFHVIHLLEKI